MESTSSTGSAGSGSRRVTEERPDLEAVRRLVFSLVGECVNGGRVLDLYCGTGVLGIEALRRGARHVTFVDRSLGKLKVAEEEIRNLGVVHQTTLLCADALSVPRATQGEESYPFGIVLLYPPSGVAADEMDLERLFARMTAILRSPLTAREALLCARLPAACDEALPFAGSRESRCGDSRLILLTKASLEIGD